MKLHKEELTDVNIYSEGKEEVPSSFVQRIRTILCTQENACTDTQRTEYSLLEKKLVDFEIDQLNFIQQIITNFLFKIFYTILKPNFSS